MGASQSVAAKIAKIGVVVGGIAFIAGIVT